MIKYTAEEEQTEGSAPVYHPNQPIPASRAAAMLTIHAQRHAVERRGAEIYRPTRDKLWFKPRTPDGKRTSLIINWPDYWSDLLRFSFSSSSCNCRSAPFRIEAYSSSVN